ncbi:hypothetical protein [Actinoplanes sp. M2I2]|uniref:hypothetical protein n=1 Tax=Actinoplanes sp. M2I2 TaxID=1734444 RepID=UPI002020545E|nr:hypothetical protein [Actinoplanes sp. M2I2]
MLAGALVLLLSGPLLGRAAGPCPERVSVAAYAGERRLLVRTGSAGGSTVLLHLCSDRPMRSWSVRDAAGGPIAVQPVAEDVAVTAVPLPAGGTTTVTVVVAPRTGSPLTFTARAGTR